MTVQMGKGQEVARALQDGEKLQEVRIAGEKIVLTKGKTIPGYVNKQVSR